MCTKAVVDFFTGGDDKKKATAPPPMPAAVVQGGREGPTAADFAMRQAQQKQARLAAQNRGQGSTLLTGGAGVTDQAATRKKTLLGM